MAVSIAQANAMLGGLSATLYVQAHTGDPGSAGTSNTIVGSTRGTVSIPVASGGSRTASGSSDCRSIPLGTTVTHVSYWDSLTLGAFQFSEELASSVSFTYAGTLRLTTQTFSLQTTTGQSQTSTSVNTDSTSASDSNVARFIANHTDGTTSSDVVGAAVGIFTSNTDTTTSSDAHGLVIGLAITDTGTSSDENTAEVPGGGPALIDDFSSNTIASYTVTGDQASGVSVTGGHLKSSTVNTGNPGDTTIVRTGSSLQNGDVQVVIRTENAEFTGLSNANVDLRTRISGTSCLRVRIYNSSLTLSEVISGTPTQLGTYNITPYYYDNQDYTLKITMSGTSVSVSWNGTVRITATTTHNVAGAYGFYVWRNTGDDGDNWWTSGLDVLFDDLTAG